MPAKIALMLTAMTQDDVDVMQPAERRRFAELCRHWVERMEPQQPPPKTGVLASLKNGDRAP